MPVSSPPALPATCASQQSEDSSDVTFPPNDQPSHKREKVNGGFLVKPGHVLVALNTIVNDYPTVQEVFARNTNISKANTHANGAIPSARQQIISSNISRRASGGAEEKPG